MPPLFRCKWKLRFFFFFPQWCLLCIILLSSGKCLCHFNQVKKLAGSIKVTLSQHFSGPNILIFSCLTVVCSGLYIINLNTNQQFRHYNQLLTNLFIEICKTQWFYITNYIYYNIIHWTVLSRGRHWQRYLGPWLKMVWQHWYRHSSRLDDKYRFFL